MAWHWHVLPSHGMLFSQHNQLSFLTENFEKCFEHVEQHMKNKTMHYIFKALETFGS